VLKTTLTAVDRAELERFAAEELAHETPVAAASAGGQTRLRTCRPHDRWGRKL
jgi:hypothetical protein